MASASKYPPKVIVVRLKFFLEWNKFLVTEKYDFECRDKSKLLKSFIGPIPIFMQTINQKKFK